MLLNRTLRRSLLLTVFSSILQLGWAQERVYYFNHLSVEEGLTSGQYNYYVYQDSEGLVWISSITGLNRFDGKTVKQYHPNSNKANSLLSELAAQSLFFESKDHSLWFTNKVSLARYDREQDCFSHYQFVKNESDTIQTGYYWCFLNPKNGELFVSADRNLFYLNIKTPEKYDSLGTVPIGIKDKMFETAEGDYRLFLINKGTDTLRLRSYSSNKPTGKPAHYRNPAGGKIQDVFYESDQLVWLATDKGLCKLNLNTGNWEQGPLSFKDSKVENIVQLAVLEDGRLLVATLNNGIFFFDPETGRYTEQVFHVQNGNIEAFHPTIDRMNIDWQENLWVSAKDDGVYYTNLKKLKFKIETLAKHSQYNSVKSLVEGENGIIWGLNERQVFKISDEVTVVCNLPVSGIDLEQTTRIYQDKKARLWIGTLSELLLLEPGKEDATPIDQLPANETNSDPWL